MKPHDSSPAANSIFRRGAALHRLAAPDRITHSAEPAAQGLTMQLPLLLTTLTTQALLPSAAACSLQGVRNFRSVSRSLPELYRSGCLEQATDADAAHILDSARIRTIIDLRNDDEIRKARDCATEFGQKLLMEFQHNSPVGHGCVASEGTGCLSWHHVPLWANTDGFFDEVERRMSAVRKAEAAVYKSMSGKKYNQLLYDEVARGKQQLLYTAMLKSGALDSWQKVLSLAADRSGGAVLINCAQGKDRTGLVSALLQHAAGDSEDEIIEAYSMSEALLALSEDADDSTADDAQAAAQGGVDWSALRGSPPSAMRETLSWIRQEYGAIDYLLASMGCENEWRKTLLASGLSSNMAF
eukprot:6197509-Pleurochrysis_carterae.AAC.2